MGKRILISGAGIAGAALAHRLLRCGFTPTLIERAPAFRDSGYMIDVWGIGYDLLEEYGLLEAARARAYVFDRLKFVDEESRTISGLGAGAFRRALGERFFSIPRGDLARVLYDSVKDRVETLYATSIEALREDDAGIGVTLSTGAVRRFELVVGADGLRSRTREAAFPAQDARERFLGYCAASFVADGYPHREEGAYVSFAKPGRQISRYAMRGGRSAFLLVFAQDRPPVEALHDAAARKALLHAKFGRDGWEAPQILERLEAAADLYFDAVCQVRLPRWSRGRVALVGDAAYCPSLLAGAGSAFAMLGAYVLAGELKAAAGDHSRAFAAYERRLRPFLSRQQDAAARFAGFFAPKTAFGLALRDRALQAMSFEPLGALVVRRMIGERFPLPRFD